MREVNAGLIGGILYVFDDPARPSLENVDPVVRAGVGVLFRVGSRSHMSAAHHGSWSSEATPPDALAVGEVDSA